MIEPIINLHVAGEGDFELTPDNSGLFTFWGHAALANGDTIDLATRNHAYFVTGEEPDRRGHYVFDPETVRQIGIIMLREHFPANLFKRRVPEADEDAYQKYLAQNVDTSHIPDEIPDGWDG